MRIAVLGVGLIGGSIGLAARRRLEAEVAGFDPDRALLDRAAELGASTRRGERGGRGGGRRDRLLRRTGHRAPRPGRGGARRRRRGLRVTDVGSVKREVIAALGSESRFIGGHPLAGAETAGVENARADLFEGARWYLTPTAEDRRDAL